jgi:hypothetical protein
MNELALDELGAVHGLNNNAGKADMSGPSTSAVDKEKGPAVQGLQELGAGANQIEQSDCRFLTGRAPLRQWAI